MPTVQKYGSRRVSPAGLPQARLQTPAETEVSAGGARARATGRAALRIAEGVEAIATPVLSMSLEEITRLKAEERRTADETALLKASNQIAAWWTKKAYDPQTGVFAQRGEAAFPLPEQVHAEYDQVTSAIATTMATPEQQLAFEKLRAREWQSIDLQVRRHVLGEQQAYQEGQLTAYVGNKSNAAIANALDPRLIADNLRDAIAAIKTHAPKLGKSQAQVDQLVRGTESAVHLGVIDQLLTANKTAQAEQYFTLTREAIDGDKRDDVQRALETGSLQKQAQEHTARILAEGGTEAEQRQKAKSLDSKVQDEVLQRLGQEWAFQDRQKRQADENDLTEAYRIVEQTHSTRGIPPALRDRIATHMPGLHNFAQDLAHGVPTETDWEAYYAWKTMAAKNPAKFVTANLIADKHRLGDTEFKELTALQFGMRTADSGGAGATTAPARQQQLTTFSTVSQLFESTLREHGFDPNPKPGTTQARAVAQLRRQLELKLQYDQSDAGGNQTPTNTYIQQTLDEIIADQILVPGTFYGTTPTPVLELTPKDIPAEERAVIEQTLRNAGRPVTDQTIMEVYIRGRQKERDLRRPRPTAPVPPGASNLMRSH